MNIQKFTQKSIEAVQNCEKVAVEYEEIRRYKLEKPVFPADTELSEMLLGKDAQQEALSHAIPEFLNFNIVECEIING